MKTSNGNFKNTAILLYLCVIIEILSFPFLCTFTTSQNTIQQCCKMLRSNFACVWPGLNSNHWNIVGSHECYLVLMLSHRVWVEQTQLTLIPSGVEEPKQRRFWDSFGNKLVVKFLPTWGHRLREWVKFRLLTRLRFTQEGIHFRLRAETETTMAAGQNLPELGGYDLKFTSEVPDDFRCPVCQLPMRDPKQIEGCGHRFCTICLEGLFG